MPTARVPTNILKLRGSDKKHPDRMRERENEPVNVNPIGDPPEWLTESELEAWGTIIEKCIDGVLGESDNIAVAITSRLLAKFMIGETTGQEDNLLSKYLGQMGMVPSERSRIQVPKKKPKNTFDD